MRKRDIDTPALILDLDVAEANIAAMAEYFRARPQKLRPHFKTPKTPEIARRQLAAGVYVAAHVVAAACTPKGCVFPFDLKRSSIHHKQPHVTVFRRLQILLTDNKTVPTDRVDHLV